MRQPHFILLKLIAKNVQRLHSILNFISKKSYVGETKDLQNRLAEHNAREHTGYTARYKPWVLIYSENFDSRSDAMKKEKYFKTGTGREEIQKIINELLNSQKQMD